MQINYKQVVIWDANVIDVGFLGSEQSVPLALRELAINGVYIVTGAPAAVAGHWAPGAQVANAVDGTLYIMTGTTASPAWGIVENSGDQPVQSLAYNSDATAGPLTITAAKMVNAILDRDGGATNRADVTPSAALLLAAVPGAQIGSTFTFYYRNISTTAGQRTVLTIGSGVTLSGNVEVVAGQSQMYVARFTNVTVAAVTLYAVNGGLSGALAQVISASTVNSLRATTGATTVAPILAPVGSDTNIGAELDAKGSGSVNIGKTATGPIIIGRGALKSLINGKTLTSLGTTQNTTPTAAQLLGGLLTQTGATGAGTATLDNGTNISALIPGVAVGDSFECMYAVLGGAQTITLTSATGATVIGTAAIPSGKIARMTFVNTGANTWNVYCTVSS